MAFNPSSITKQNILNAILKIESQKIDLIPSNKWDVVINGKLYPPKEVMRYAHEDVNGEKVWELGGGESTNKYLKKFGFEIQDKRSGSDPLQELIDSYKKNVHKGDDELYKWKLLGKHQGKPDIEAADLEREFKSITYFNLIYPVGISVIYDLAKNRQEKYREQLHFLFDENIALSKRIKEFPERLNAIYREIVPDPSLPHHHDERTMASLLTFHNPSRYAFYKNSFYKKICDLLGEKSAKKGEKYVHYMSLVENFISEYIVNDQELLDLSSKRIPEGGYKDPTYTLLAQDIIYQGLEKKERCYWRIGTTDGKGKSYWDVMQAESHTSIGWTDLGDLNQLDPKNKSQISAEFTKLGYYKDQNSLLSRKSGEVYNFFENIKPGDVVLAQEGAAVQGIGIVQGEYEFNTKFLFAHLRETEWLVLNPDLKNVEGLQTTVFEIKEKDTIKKIDQLLANPSEVKEISLKEGTQMKMPLNQIIFGPPGTGKTHKLINDYFPLFTSTTGPTTLTQDSASLVEQYSWWQIIAAAVYDMKKANVPEIAKHPYILAKVSSSSLKNLKPILWSILQTHTKIDCKFVNAERRIEPLLFEKDKDSYWTIDEKAMDNDAPEIKEFVSAWKNPVGAATQNKKTNYDFVTFHQSFTYEDFVEGIKPVLDVDSESSDVGYTIQDGIFKKICERARNDRDNKYALFIDEINRGNVSQIFGELITLIEEDKREGGAYPLSIKLAYSKENFSVPSNLYIIGTMNTADRSVEALDTALRRRFSFQELLPDADLIKTNGKIKGGVLNGIDLVQVLKTLNKRIVKLKDKDHMIGHSYFLSVSDLNDLKMTFQRYIIPLLQEYFFGDYSKIGLVVGVDFFENQGTQNTEEDNLFAEFNDYESSDLAAKPVYRLKDVSKFSDDEIKNAMVKLLNA